MDTSDKWFRLDNHERPIWGSKEHEFKSHRPDLLTPLIARCLDSVGLGEAERRSIACCIASGVHDDEAQSIAFWRAWLAHGSAVPPTRPTVGTRPRIVASIATASQIRRDVVALEPCRSHRVTRQPRQTRTQTYDKKAVLRLAAGITMNWR